MLSMVRLDGGRHGGGSIGFWRCHPIALALEWQVECYLCVCASLIRISMRRQCQKVEMKFKVHIVVNIRHSKLIRLTCRTRHRTRTKRRLQNSLFIAHRNRACGKLAGRASARSRVCYGNTALGKGATEIFRRNAHFSVEFQFQFGMGHWQCRRRTHLISLISLQFGAAVVDRLAQSHISNEWHNTWSSCSSCSSCSSSRMSFIYSIEIVSCNSLISIEFSVRRIMIRLGR